MEKFVTRAINAYLSEYVEHLSSDQITVNIFHGMISVSDIVLKKKSLQGLWSGICVHSGNINRVILKCPATWLNRTAWSLTIDELHVFFKDEPEIKKDQCDEKVVRKLFWLQFSQMLSRILNNLQINIFDCHLKYCNDHRTFECRLRNVEFENTKDYLRRASQDSCQINEDVADEEEEEEEELEEEEEVHDGEEADREEEGGKDKLKACLLAIGIGLCLCVIGLCAACFTRSNEGLYVYRFEVPIGEVYRFWLTWRQGPSKSPLDLGKFVDYAFSRVADDAICSKHLRQEDAFEVHLGEADYIALLRDGQCACAAAESSDVSAGDVCRRSRHHREDKSRGDEAVSRGDTGDESVGSFARGKSDADNYGCETERLDLAAVFQENDCGGGKDGAPDVSSADHEATWSRGDVPTATRAATASKPASVGGPSQEQVNCRVAYSDSASSGYRAEVPKTAAADLSESEPGFTPDQSESEASASSSASSSDDDSPAEDASRTEGCRDGGPMTGKEMGVPDGDIWKTHTFEKCHRTSIRAKDVGEERTYIISSATADVPHATMSPVGRPPSSSADGVDPAIPNPTPLDGSSQSVEIITAKESRLAALGPLEGSTGQKEAPFFLRASNRFRQVVLCEEEPERGSGTYNHDNLSETAFQKAMDNRVACKNCGRRFNTDSAHAVVPETIDERQHGRRDGNSTGQDCLDKSS